MKLRLILSALLLVAIASPALAQDKTAKPAKPSAPAPDMMEGMKKWVEAATPGAPHKALEPMIGEWELTTKMWMSGPGSPAMESKGTATARWILGGRYVQSETQGEMMGMPMTGIGITGYDNFKKKYTSFWIDNLGTAMFLSEGSADTAGKVFTFQGKMDEPMTGEKDKPVKHTHRMVSPDKHVFEMYDLSLGPNAKVVEITYTRKK